MQLHRDKDKFLAYIRIRWSKKSTSKFYRAAAFDESIGNTEAECSKIWLAFRDSKAAFREEMIGGNDSFEFDILLRSYVSRTSIVLHPQWIVLQNAMFCFFLRVRTLDITLIS